MPTEQLPPRLRTVLAWARRVAGRVGHDEVAPVHLARAMFIVDPDRASRLLGEGAPTILDRLSADLPVGSGSPRLSAQSSDMLQWSAADAEDGFDRLADAVLAELALPVPPPSGDAPVGTGGSAASTGPVSDKDPAPGSDVAPGSPSAPLTVYERDLDPDAMFEVVGPQAGLVGLDALVDDLLELLARHTPASPCIVGRPGAGRTTAIRALATRLERDGERLGLGGAQVVRIRAEAVLGGRRGDELRAIRQGAGDGSILVLDDLEVLLMLSSPATDLDLRGVVRSILGRPDILSVATLDEGFRDRFETEEPELFAELEPVTLPDLGGAHLREIAGRRVPELRRHHRVAIPTAMLDIAAQPPRPGDERGHPGLMLERLDHAALRALLRNGIEVEQRDFELGAVRPSWAPVQPDDLAARLRDRIKGQNRAIDALTARLAITTARLDLRPQRPNGVFLFAGPTGVGKTALAKALAAELFDDDDRMIRLDMTEYAEDWSVSRLYGPHPGYKGSDQPEGWFTSRVLNTPASIILLDEMEKAHPAVWAAFLQVFDDGRMTDSRGRVARFGDTVIIMTSNLGTRAFSTNPLGFTGDGSDGSDAVDAARAAIERTLPPELVNRIDDIAVFEPLTRDVIAEIAESEIDRAFHALADRGWHLSLSADALDWIANEGYDPTYGARHLQRNIESKALRGLVGLPTGAYKGEVHDGAIRWGPVRS